MNYKKNYHQLSEVKTGTPKQKQRIFKKIKNKEHVCEACNKIFYNADAKGRFCFECIEPITVECACGCGDTVTKATWRIRINPFVQSHDKRGKTYKEIYGTDTPGCGFKSGAENPMRNEYTLDKVLSNINKGIKYKDIWFRSSYEVEIYKLLDNTAVLLNKTLKINDKLYKPDFIVGNTIIEVSGIASATEKGRARNKRKILEYLEYSDFNVIFITNRKFIPHYSTIDNSKFKLLEYEKTIHNTKRII